MSFDPSAALRLPPMDPSNIVPGTGSRCTVAAGLLIAALLTGCASSGASIDRVPNSSESVEPRLRQEVDRWMGTPHVLGGTTATGMDCSAFVQRVFSDAFQVDLPRVTEDQVRTGRRIGRSELRPGDLVFFRPPAKTRHVGIYLSGGEFAHVSSSEGVTISELSAPYWQSAYWTARRLLEGAPVDAGSGGRVGPSPASHSGRLAW